MTRTWHMELAMVVLILGAAAALTNPSSLANWIGVIAVSLSFAHAQVADRLAERDAARPRPAVACHRWATRYLVAKELAWVAVFVLLGAWTALVGAGLFLLYPLWRRHWRTRFPLEPELKRFDPKRAVITFKGVTLHGYAEGTFIESTPKVRSETWTLDEAKLVASAAPEPVEPERCVPNRLPPEQWCSLWCADERNCACAAAGEQMCPRSK
jgi:hypothetical protein